MISLSRETVAALYTAGAAILPSLVAYERNADAWAISEALREAEAALKEDQREDEAVVESGSEVGHR